MFNPECRHRCNEKIVSHLSLSAVTQHSSAYPDAGMKLKNAIEAVAVAVNSEDLHHLEVTEEQHFLPKGWPRWFRVYGLGFRV